jgi:hypothetical protein
MSLSNIKNKLSNESNLKLINRNPYGFSSSDHINRISSNYRLHNGTQRDSSNNSIYDTQNYANNNKLNKNLEGSSLVSNNLMYNNNSHNENNTNLNTGNNNISNDNTTPNNTFQNSLHDTVFVQSKPRYEFYGYAFYLVSFLALSIYLIWAFSTEAFFQKIGFYYYPNRYWAIALPDYVVVIILFYFAIFLSYNFIHTPSFNSLNTVTDKYSNLMKNVKYTRVEDDDDIPDLQDIPISIVNAYLYSDSFYPPSEPYSTYSPT